MPHRSSLPPGQSEEIDIENHPILSAHVAFGARHLCEEIQGAKLYEEKHHKEKTKTAASALVLCLNIGIDPPDVPKIPPFSRVEAWFDPTDANSLRALETIGKNLQAQYERWQPRARFKQCLDPTLDDVKNLCISLRRNFKNDRILFHYNGHGVPRPTENGEIWVFNTKFTKYIPLSLYDLQRWLGAPSVYVFDCQNAGRIIRMYEHFCHRRKREATAAAQRQQDEILDGHLQTGPVDPGRTDAHRTGTHQENGGAPMPTQENPNLLVSMENTIMLAACGETEDLPQSAVLPADVFTACLTTPVRMALRWHSLGYQDKFPGCFDEALLDRIPGTHSNRMSLLGEVNWIFTAVTDTIAWCSFPIDVFQKLFRQDLLVAGLFRNFLLAERIMRMCGCTPISAPALPPTFRHPVWNAWDHALDRLMHYLPRILKLLEGTPHSELKLPILLDHTYSRHPPHPNGGISQQLITANPTLPVPNEQVLDTTLQRNGTTGAGKGENYHQRFARHAHVAGQPNGLVDPNAANQPVSSQRNISTRPPSKLTNEHHPSLFRSHEHVPQIPARPGLVTTTKTDNQTVVAPPGFSRPSGAGQRVPVGGFGQHPRPLPNNPGILPATHHLLESRKKPLTALQEDSRSVAGHITRFPSEPRTEVNVDRIQTAGGAIAAKNSINKGQLTSAAPLGAKIAQNPENHIVKSPANKDVASIHLDTSKVPRSQDDEEADDSDDDDDDDEDTDEELDDSDGIDDNVVENETGEIRELTNGYSTTEKRFSSTNHQLYLNTNARYFWSGDDILKGAHSDTDKCHTPFHRPHSYPPCASLYPPSPPMNTPNYLPRLSQAVNNMNKNEEEVKQRTNEANLSNLPNGPLPKVQPTPKPVGAIQQVNAVTTDSSSVVSTVVSAIPPSQPVTTASHKAYTTTATIGPSNTTTNNPCVVNKPQSRTTAGIPNNADQQTTQNKEAVLPPRTNSVVLCTAHPTTAISRDVRPPNTTQISSNGPSQPSSQPTNATPDSSVYAGSVIGGNGPASFFTSQMTAFKVWLRTADEKQPPAMQLPILLQILLSQSHRTRAMQLLSEFLDLGPWAVTHCLMVGILPYIVRLFSSNLFEVKPHLVFIWGKIIASAQTEFSRNDSVRDVGYKYFINCLSDSKNLSPLTRTITAFALAKMLEKEPNGEPDSFFQEVSLKQNFIPLALAQLYDNPPTQEREPYVRMRLWFIFALGKLWRKNDEARWFAARYNVIETLVTYLNDVSPEVRAAAVYAFGTLADNITMDAAKQDHADQINQQICAYLIKLVNLEASGLVRCELVAALCGLVRQFESQLCAVSYRYIQWLRCAVTSKASPPTRPSNRPSRHSVALPPPASARQSVCNENSVLNNCTPRKYFIASPKTKRSDLRAVHTFFSAGNNIYAQLWMALVHLSNDPHPKVSNMSRVVTQFILSKSICVPPSSLLHVLVDHNDYPAEFSEVSRDEKANSSKDSHPVTEPTASNPPPASRDLTCQPSSRCTASGLSSHQTPVTAASGPPPTLYLSPSSHAAATHSSSASPEHHSIKSGAQRRHHGANMVLTSTFLTHSAQYPGRRHHQVDPLFRKHLPDSVGQPTSTHTPKDTKPSTADAHPLNAVQKTQFFAWSCRWFTRPLLAQYGGENPVHQTDPVGTPNTVGIPKSPRSSTSSDAELAALCAVAVDEDAVAYANRFTRLAQQRAKFKEGCTAWLNSLTNNHRSSIRSTTEHNRIGESHHKRHDTVSTEPGELNILAHTVSSGLPSVIRFHPHQPHMAVADHSGLALYSSVTLERLNYICTPPDVDPFCFIMQPNDSTHGRLRSRITDIQFVSCCEERSLVLCAHDSGSIRIWRNYLDESGQNPEIVTAWTGLTDLLPSSNPVGVVVHWSPSSSQLILGGDAKHIRLWDCERESRIRDVPTGADACVTVLTRSTDQRLLCAGFGDGTVRVFDLRISTSCSPSSHHSDCHIFSAQADSGWIHAAAFTSSGRLYAAGSSGGIAAWQLTTTPSRLSGHRSRRTTENTGNTYGSGRSTDMQRFERLPSSPRLSLPPNSLVNCAALKVDLPLPSAHILVAGLGGSTQQLSIHRLHDGSVYSSCNKFPEHGKHPSFAPSSIAIHPVQPIIAAGLQDGTVMLLAVGSKQISEP